MIKASSFFWYLLIAWRIQTWKPKGYVKYFNSCVIDCVLFVVGRNYSTDIVSHPIVGQILTLHHDAGFFVSLDNSVRVECLFQVRYPFWFFFSREIMIFNVDSSVLQERKYPSHVTNYKENLLGVHASNYDDASHTLLPPRLRWYGSTTKLPPSIGTKR